MVAHCLASLTNFLEHCSPDYIKSSFNYIYENIMTHLRNGISFVREACLSTLSALAEGSDELFDPHYNDVINLIF